MKRSPRAGPEGGTESGTESGTHLAVLGAFPVELLQQSLLDVGIGAELLIDLFREEFPPYLSAVVRQLREESVWHGQSARPMDDRHGE